MGMRTDAIGKSVFLKDRPASVVIERRGWTQRRRNFYLPTLGSLIKKEQKFWERGNLMYIGIIVNFDSNSFGSPRGTKKIETTSVLRQKIMDVLSCFGVMCIHIMACITDRDLTYH